MYVYNIQIFDSPFAQYQNVVIYFIRELPTLIHAGLMICSLELNEHAPLIFNYSLIIKMLQLWD